MSLDTGAVVADPFVPTAHLVELLRTAARPARVAHRLRRSLRPLAPRVAAPTGRRPARRPVPCSGWTNARWPSG